MKAPVATIDTRMNGLRISVAFVSVPAYMTEPAKNPMAVRLDLWLLWMN